MFDLMNEMSELVYVTDIKTYEFLFMNTAGKKMFGLDELTNIKCYKALHNKEEPCEFCTTHLLTIDSYYSWEISNEVAHRHYLLKDRLIDWGGIPARIEIAFDTTQQETEKIALKNSLDTQMTVLECVKTLYTNDILPTAFHEILKLIGNFLDAERTYIFDIHDNMINAIAEWHSDNTADRDSEKPSSNISLVSRWLDIFTAHQCVIIDNIDNYRESDPSEYDLLKTRGVNCLVIAPLELDGCPCSIIGVTNPHAEQIENIAMMLETLSYFITSYIQRQKDKRQLELLSYHDVLTGTFNRNAFMRDLQYISKAPANSLGIVYVDVNGMKEINDLHGHPYGDQILIRATEIILTAFPKESLYRIGGDEFVVIHQHASELSFQTAVQTLRYKVDTDGDFHVSIGAKWVPCCEDIHRLNFDVNEMMYEDKKLYYHTQVASKRYRRETDDILHLTQPGILQSLLEQEHFIIYIQPKVSIQSREIIGAEALVRMLSPDNELIPPDQFIPLLEATHLISMVDFFVFESMCKKIQTWLEDGKNIFPISVNFSRYSLIEVQFTQRLNDIWKKYQIPKNLIEIEITESMNLADNRVFLDVAKELHRLDFILSIDDFGVKHANLSLFTLIKFDVLKIDKILIDDIQANETSQIVLQSISDICRKMGIHLIVEGVETEEQLSVLQKINCEGAQGYLFDRPLPLPIFQQKYISSY